MAMVNTFSEPALTTEDRRSMETWLKLQTETAALNASDNELGGQFEDLNEKQQLACNIILKFVQDHVQDGRATPQLLLNISGAAGTGKSFWLNTLRRIIRTEYQGRLPANFIQTAAPSGTAAFIIGGKTLHSLLRLPIGASKGLKALEGDALARLQLSFEGVGLLVIDEKSMIGARK